MSKDTLYVKCDMGVGVLLAIDSRNQEGKFLVKLHTGKTVAAQSIDRITEAEYNQLKLVESTKPKSRSKK